MSRPNFAVMAFILYKVFFKPVLKVLDGRSNKINSALDNAERREQEAKDIDFVVVRENVGGVWCRE